MTEQNIQTSSSIFIPRSIAFILDIVIIYPLLFLVGIVLNIILGPPVSPFEAYLRSSVNYSLPFWIYSILSDRSKSGSTLGKKIMKIKVFSYQEEQIKLSQAILRTAVKLIPWEITHLTFFGLSEGWGTFSMLQMILLIVLYGLIFFYIIILIKNKGKRAVHDFVAKTKALQK